MIDNELFTFKEISEMFDIPVKTISKNYYAGNIDGIKLFRCIYVSKTSVQNWIHTYRPRSARQNQGTEELFYTMEEAFTLISDIIKKTRN